METTIQIQAHSLEEHGSTFIQVSTKGIEVSGVILPPGAEQAHISPKCSLSWTQLDQLHQLLTESSTEPAEPTKKEEAF